MKRLLTILLAILLLAGCGKEKPVSEKNMVQPVWFYYCANLSDDQTEHDVVAAEVRDLGAGARTMEEIVREYVKGPLDPALISPFPQNVEILDVMLENGLLTIDINAATKEISGIQRTVAAACLVRTMTQFPEVREIQLQAEGKPLPGDWSGPWEEENFLLVDDTATSNNTVVKLYFADAQGRYLVEEPQNNFFPSEAELPAYIVRQLLDGPQDDAHQMTLPDGTRLLGIQVEDGLCTVNFSEDFVRNRPEHHAGARLAVLSVVNSLTELPTVERVRFLSGGQEIPEYSGLDLTQTFYRDEAAFGAGLDQPLAMDLNMYVPAVGQTKLAQVPVVIRRTAGKTLAADVMSALLNLEASNAYGSPIPDGTMVMAMALEGGICRVTFSSSFALCDADPVQARLAVRSVVATLCDLEGIDKVAIEIHNGKLTSVDLSQPMEPRSDWLLP